MFVRYVTPLLILWMTLTISACGSRQAPPAPAVVDEAFERTSRAASSAFAQGAYQRAADLYREALEGAYRRDDHEAIVDTQYNLALALLHLGALAAARTVVADAKAELARADQAVPMYLLLLEATLLYRSGQTTVAWRLSEQILTRAAAPDVIARTQFLRGLMAAGRADTAGLRASVAAIANASTPELRADHAELHGYLAMAERQWAAAVQAFDTAAALRRASLDYSSMARALAKAGEASEQSGRQRAAAIFYLRAGRSAAHLDQKREALTWLQRAQLLARQAGDTRTLQDARALLARLQARELGQDG